MSALDERQLILQAKDGSREAFQALVVRHMKQAYNIAYGFVKDHEDAQDIAQESFIRVHQSLRSFRGDAQFGTWLYRIVTNLSLNRVKQRSAMINRTENDQRSGQQPGHNPLTLQDPDVQGHVERALHQLPTLQRAVVILRHLDGLSTKQVSGILRCSEGTVKTHLHRALKKLRVSLAHLGTEIL